MCLGVPGKVLEVKGDIAIVEINGVKAEVVALLVPEIKPGDYVIVHAGTIISIISEEGYKETVRLLKELAGAMSPE